MKTYISADSWTSSAAEKNASFCHRSKLFATNIFNLTNQHTKKKCIIWCKTKQKSCKVFLKIKLVIFCSGRWDSVVVFLVFFSPLSLLCQGPLSLLCQGEERERKGKERERKLRERRISDSVLFCSLPFLSLPILSHSSIVCCKFHFIFFPFLFCLLRRIIVGSAVTVSRTSYCAQPIIVLQMDLFHLYLNFPLIVKLVYCFFEFIQKRKYLKYTYLVEISFLPLLLYKPNIIFYL